MTDSFFARVVSSFGDVFSFCLLSYRSHSLRAVSWSVSCGCSNSIEHETYIDFFVPDEIEFNFNSTTENKQGFSCIDAQGNDICNVPIHDFDGGFTLDKYGSVVCTSDNYIISLESRDGVIIKLVFSWESNSDTYKRSPSILASSVEGSISFPNKNPIIFAGHGWIKKVDYFCESKLNSFRYSGQIFGVTSRGLNFCISCSTSQPAIVEIQDSNSFHRTEIGFQVRDSWISPCTFQSYPAVIDAEIHEENIALRILTQVNDLEICSIVSEGKGHTLSSIVGVCSTADGVQGITGTAVFFGREMLSLKCIMSKIGLKVQKHLLATLSSHGRTPIEDRVFKSVFAPIKVLVERGGKSWRSFLFCVVSNLFAKKNFECLKYLQAVELLHVGSLIIDDIEDESHVRRGGPCIHHLYTTSQAINSGCAAFFSALHVAGIDDLPPEKALKIHQLVMNTLRLGHNGQGLDICGLHEITKDNVDDPQQLQELVDYIHETKTGELVSFICSFACVLSEYSEIITNSLSSFGRKIGTAFQIIDDTLDLSVPEDDSKYAEDIRNGKLTYPFVKALQGLDPNKRKYFLNKFLTQPLSSVDLKELITLIQSTHAVQLSQQDAKNIIIEAWRTIDPLLPSSIQKQYLHALCCYIFHKR